MIQATDQTAVPAGGAGAWALAHLDAALRFVACDPLFRREFGHAVLGSGLGCVVHPGFAGVLRARLDDLLAGDVSRLAHHTVMLRRDQTPAIVEMTAVVARGRGTDCIVLAVRTELGAHNRTSMVSMVYAAGVALTGHWPPKVNPVFVA